VSEQNDIQSWLKEHNIDDVEAFVPDMAYYRQTNSALAS